MLTQLSTVKARLAIPEADTTNDALLTAAIKAVSARFDKATNRNLARAENATFEFPSNDTELSPPAYPVESVSKFELKTDEAEGWTEQPDIKYLIRNACVISLPRPLSTLHSALSRITYAGGYVLPGTERAPGQTPLPDDLEQAAVEQVAFWFQNREHIGLKTYWPSGMWSMTIISPFSDN